MANASLADMFQISQDVTFQGRVQAALLSACVSIGTEGFSVLFHRERSIFAANILATTTTPNPYVTLFTNSVATDPTCSADAATSVGGSSLITSTNRTTACAAITDAHISAAVSAQFNSFIREPNN